jgi:hypothetical protein
MSLRDGGLILTETQGLALAIAFVTMVAGGYLLAWKAKRTASRGLGTLLIVIVAGLLGLFFLAQAVGALTESAPVGSPWAYILAIPMLFAIPTLCFAIAAIFIRRTLRYRADGKESR